MSNGIEDTQCPEIGLTRTEERVESMWLLLLAQVDQGFVALLVQPAGESAEVGAIAVQRRPGQPVFEPQGVAEIVDIGGVSRA